MKRNVGTLCLITALTAIFVLSLARPCLGQDRAQVKVKKSSVVTGVVVVDVVRGTKTLELQCNDGQPTCKNLKPGDYWLVELPKNWGMYDCRNAEIFPGGKELPEEPDPATRVGAYCLIEK